jgi:hypothetical protein
MEVICGATGNANKTTTTPSDNMRTNDIEVIVDRL